MYFWLLQKMLTNCRSEVNGNFNSLVRNSGLSFSLFLEEMLLLLHTPSSTVGFPTVGRSVRCSNAFSCSQAGVPSGYAPYSMQNLLFSFCLRKSNEAFLFLKESGKSHFICNVYLCTGGAVTITCCAGKVLVSLTPPVPNMWMGTFQREISLPSAQRFCGGGGLLGDASWKYSCFIQLFGLMGFVCWTPLLTRLQPGLAVHSLFAGQVVGSTAVFVMCGQGWRGEKVPQCTVQIQSEGRRARSAVQTSHNSTFANTCCIILLSRLLWPSAELSQWLVLCCLATGRASIQLSVVVIRVFLLYGSK